MSSLLPADPAVLATAVVDSLVISADPDAPASGIYYWTISRPWRDALVRAVTECPSAPLRDLGTAVLAAPRDIPAYRALHAALVAGHGRPEVDEILRLGWRAESNNRLGHVLGHRYPPVSGEVTAAELRELPVTEGCPPGAQPEVLLVIGFRDRTPGGGNRLRNLIACLRSLRDQSYDRSNYQVTVVETDDRPRWREVIEPLADHYIFAVKEDTFNKSWAINVGFVNTPGPTEILCAMDADVLCDRDFVARSAARFTNTGVMGFFPYRDMFAMDDESTWWAIRERLFRGAPDVDSADLRGFTLRRGPGCLIWCRADAYRRVNGMDERYEGWGGEDIDFNYRFGFDAALDAFDDQLLHMRHPASSALRDDGELINAHLVPGTWSHDEPIGRVDKFAPVGAGVAGAST